ncbi:MAG TPA: hypothetical protein VFL53_10055 [Pseudolabrys sp.]|nr:hypothetical protein [Pseudolabrys sp.]
MTRMLLLASVGMLLGYGSALADNKGERCTKSSVSCYDTKENKARTCVTTTCTYADGHTTTSVTVEMQGPGGKKIVRPVQAGQMVTVGNKSMLAVSPAPQTPPKNLTNSTKGTVKLQKQ